MGRPLVKLASGNDGHVVGSHTFLLMTSSGQSIRHGFS